MKVVLLAGGFGTRLAEFTDVIPKPMVEIGGKPIIWHIMKRYAHFNHKDFFVALGYKSETVKDYFLNYRNLNSDLSIDLSTGRVESLREESIDWNVTLVDTGRDTMTGGRLKRLQKYLAGERFMLTYGDGLSDIDINSLIDFHESHGKMVTMTAVRPTARFGELELDGDKVESFIEKPQLHGGWINGGFFVIEPEFLDLISDDSIMLERQPLELASTRGELMAYRHEGFWQCMDTKRDHDLLQSLLLNGAPWEAQ
ncbi:GCD1 Nucleoside-diphosphate-sugar pyrophosphorylase involved in lipopolysaccharide biosynthesis/translation initiation factor 2B, gamma/epsilon subunits (eIF-2Bgamma/eIF-2Bepsilon) [Candidatus Nanopelagicaceae bacterium]